MKTLLSVTLFIILTASAFRSSAQPDTLSVLHISDLHIIFNSGFYQPDLAQSRQHYANGQAPLKEFLLTLPAKTNSSMVFATGDLIDFFEAETNMKEMLGFQVEQFSHLIEECSVPFYGVPGNHDISSDHRINNATAGIQENVGKAQACWTRSMPCFQDGNYYSLIRKVGSTVYRFIFLDDSYGRFNPEEHISLPYIDKVQLHWLEDQLNASEEDVEVILMHIPLRAESVIPASANALYAALAGHHSIKLILAGHNHVNNVRFFPLTPGDSLAQVQTGAFGRDPGNWRLLKFASGSILVSYPGKTEKELSIPVK